jgi:hypothetical protein
MDTLDVTTPTLSTTPNPPLILTLSLTLPLFGRPIVLQLLLLYYPPQPCTLQVLYLQTGKWLVGLAGRQMAPFFGPRPSLPPSAAYLSLLQPSWSSLLWGHEGASNGGGGGPLDLVHETASLPPMSLGWGRYDQDHRQLGQGAMPLATRLLRAFEQRARYCIVAAATALHQHSSDISKTAPAPVATESADRTYRRALRDKAMSTEGVVVARAAEAHSELLIVRALHRACTCHAATAPESGAGAGAGAGTIGADGARGDNRQHCHLPPPDLSALRYMLVLLQCTFIERSLGDFLAANCFVSASSARRGLDALTKRLLADLLPHSLRLVDAFALSDIRLDRCVTRPLHAPKASVANHMLLLHPPPSTLVCFLRHPHTGLFLRPSTTPPCRVPFAVPQYPWPYRRPRVRSDLRGHAAGAAQRHRRECRLHPPSPPSAPKAHAWAPRVAASAAAAPIKVQSDAVCSGVPSAC